MPHHAAAPVVFAVLLAGFAILQALYRLVHRPKLLIAARQLDGLAVDLHEQREVANDVQQIGFVEHSGHQALLLRQVGNVQRRRHVLFTRWGDSFPAGKVLEQAANRANAGLVEAGAYQQLAGGKQRLIALVVLHLLVGVALVAVAAQLVDGLGQRLGNRRAFALHHHQRDAVHQQHQVRHDECLAAVVARWAIDAVLADHGKAVVFWRVPVDKPNRLAPASIPARQAVQRQS